MEIHFLVIKYLFKCKLEVCQSDTGLKQELVPVYRLHRHNLSKLGEESVWNNENGNIFDCKKDMYKI